MFAIVLDRTYYFGACVYLTGGKRTTVMFLTLKEDQL